MRPPGKDPDSWNWEHPGGRVPAARTFGWGDPQPPARPAARGPRRVQEGLRGLVGCVGGPMHQETSKYTRRPQAQSVFWEEGL